MTVPVFVWYYILGMLESHLLYMVFFGLTPV